MSDFGNPYDLYFRETFARPEVIPIVLYHGRKKWRLATNFGNLFTGPDHLRPYWPLFSYQLRDLSHHSDKEIRGAALLQICLRIMKHIYDRNSMEHLPAIFSLFTQLANSKT